MISASRVIMAIHPVLILLPILVFLVLPCESTHVGPSIVANLTVDKPGDCNQSLCPENKNCTNFLLYEEKNHFFCFLINCPPDVQISCENVTNIKDLLAEQESVHVAMNKTDGHLPPHQSSGNISSQPDLNNSSANVKQPLTTNISTSSTSTPTKPPALQNHSASTVATKLQTAPSEQYAMSDVPGTTIPVTPATTSTTTTTATKTTMATTTTPSTTSTSTTATTINTTVEQTTIPQQPSSPAPSGTQTSASISPSVPTLPSSPSSKPAQPSPAPTSTKPSATTPKTSTSSLVVAPTPPKDISSGEQGRTDQDKVEVAGDPLTIHLLNTSSLLAVLMFGLLFFVVTVALFLKQAYETYKRKDYTQVDYLINGMYSDSGV